MLLKGITLSLPEFVFLDLHADVGTSMEHS